MINCSGFNRTPITGEGSDTLRYDRIPNENAVTNLLLSLVANSFEKKPVCQNLHIREKRKTAMAIFCIILSYLPFAPMVQKKVLYYSHALS